MNLTKLVVEKFKRVDHVEIDLSLSPLTILVGGNNSGKSSVLQGIHFSVTAAIASREAGRDTYTQDSLLYCPTRSFADLRHGTGYTNQSHFGHFRVFAQLPDEGEAQYIVRIYRGRNEGNVGCQRSGSQKLGSHVSSSDKLFSIYVPGLAGIPQAEQFQAESVVRRGVASGDANLYLRNVLLLIEKANKLADLQEKMRSLFPGFDITLSFDPKKDVFIDVLISTAGSTGPKCPIDLVGTGVLQALQIFSYVTLFSPRILLLDEPDAHLHPDNQTLLSKALKHIASDGSTNIIVSTHSRHLVDALRQEANFVWLKNGVVYKQGMDLDRLPLLLDIGALDSFDRIRGGEIAWVFLTEDRDTRMLQLLAQSSGFDSTKTLYFSYRTSTNFESATILAQFIMETCPGTNVIIHRDRDFMTDDEAAKVEQRIKEAKAQPFITEWCDIEGYFTTTEHVALVTGGAISDIEKWLNTIATDDHIALQHSFTRKRDDIKRLLYRNDMDKFPSTEASLGNVIPLPPEKRNGKYMLKKLHSTCKEQLGRVFDFKVQSNALTSVTLQTILKTQQPSNGIGGRAKAHSTCS